MNKYGKDQIQTQMIANLLFPVHEWIKGHHTTYWLKFFQQSQFWSKQQLQNWQKKQLHALLNDTYHHHVFYKKLWKKLPRHLEDVPLLNKKMLQDKTTQLKPEPQLGMKPGYTSGSSGTPLFYYQSSHRVSRDIAAKWRCLQWFNLEIGMREAVVWGSPLEWQRYTFLHRIRDKILNTHLFPITQIDKIGMKELLKSLVQYQPRILVGYPSVLEQVIKLNEGEESVRKLQLDAILTTAEELLPHTQHFLEEVLQCPVINSYGAREVGFIAQCCSQGNLHVMSENIIVEIMDVKTGEILPHDHMGEIVVTNLSSYGYPIIRYCTGDMGVLTEERCGCGIQLPMLKKLEGRCTDFLLNQKKQKIHRAQISAIFSLFPMIGQFKIIQHTLDEVEVICSPKNCLTDCFIRLKEKIQQCLGGTVNVTLHDSDFLTSDAKIKHRFVENRIFLRENP